MAMFLKPNPDKTVNDEPLKVFDPERKTFLPTEGAAVPSNTYWVRQLQAGDCIEVGAIEAEPVAEEAVAAAPAKKQAAKKGK